ncbi:MAG: CoA transferase [Dehalococcoidia bacterium]|nr:CoA transferase [Dehalococcoidia bacterium]
MQKKPFTIPEQFGALKGLRIVTNGVYIAEPFAPVMAGEHGATIVNLERPGEGDPWRATGYKFKTPEGKPVSADWTGERHNEYFITLDLSTPEGRDLFLDKLVPHFDIWMESSKPGTLGKWGVTDEAVLKRNPKMVIVHVSGYGQTGHRDYLGRPSYDAIAQAYGGLMSLTGLPEPRPPIRTAPWFGDFITALHTLAATLAAYIHAQKTGEGQVLDIPQFEVIQRHSGAVAAIYHNDGVVLKRRGNRDVTTTTQPYDSYEALDGWTVISATDQAQFDAVCEVLGEDPARWAKAHREPDSPEGREFDHLLRSWVNQRVCIEVVLMMNEKGVACSKIMNGQDIAEDPHYAARGLHVEWFDESLKTTVKGAGAYPKMSATPGKIWRGPAPAGADNDLIYTQVAGLSPEQIKKLQGAKVL